jgi:hypothetical protein
MSNEALRFYIATDGTAMQKAEMALVYSIQKVCSVPIRCGTVGMIRNGTRLFLTLDLLFPKSTAFKVGQFTWM